MCTAPIISPDQADGGPWLKQRTALWTAAKELHKIIAVQAIFLKAAVEHDPHGQALFERRHPSTARTQPLPSQLLSTLSFHSLIA